MAWPACVGEEGTKAVVEEVVKYIELFDGAHGSLRSTGERPSSLDSSTSTFRRHPLKKKVTNGTPESFPSHVELTSEPESLSEGAVRIILSAMAGVGGPLNRFLSSLEGEERHPRAYALGPNACA